jgi:hypothetical protein
MEAESMAILTNLLIAALMCVDTPAPGTPAVDQKIIVAFGKDSNELRRPLRLWFSEKRLVLAAAEFSLEPDGRVRLGRGSLAILSPEDAPLTTLRSDSVYLTLDRPIAKITDVSRRNIVAIEVAGGPKLMVSK